MLATVARTTADTEIALSVWCRPRAWKEKLSCQQLANSLGLFRHGFGCLGPPLLTLDTGIAVPVKVEFREPSAGNRSGELLKNPPITSPAETSFTSLGEVP